MSYATRLNSFDSTITICPTRRQRQQKRLHYHLIRLQKGQLRLDWSTRGRLGASLDCPHNQELAIDHINALNVPYSAHLVRS
jgi:hypothetical protein